jgi:molecular chaperone GrpE (heat shock protein)
VTRDEVEDCARDLLRQLLDVLDALERELDAEGDE